MNDGTFKNERGLPTFVDDFLQSDISLFGVQLSTHLHVLAMILDSPISTLVILQVSQLPQYLPPSTLEYTSLNNLNQ
jgi:hypothetical protein